MDKMHLWNGFHRKNIDNFRRGILTTIMVTRPKLTGGVAITLEQAVVRLLINNFNLKFLKFY